MLAVLPPAILASLPDAVFCRLSGIIGLRNSMAVHHGRNNVWVNCIRSGHVHSPMVARLTSEEMLELRRKAGPLGVEGTAWDIA